MKTIVLNGLKTKGEIQFDCNCPIPVHRGSISISNYLVGYFKNDKFITCFELEDEDNLAFCTNSVIVNHSPYKPVVLRISAKVQNL